jgi:acetyl-CoA carboxylase carboxyltransferase component
LLRKAAAERGTLDDVIMPNATRRRLARKGAGDAAELARKDAGEDAR